MEIRQHVRMAPTLVSAAAAIGLLSTTASAQPLGVFKWQLQSFCNVISLAVTQNGGVFTLDGFDDQCGAATRAPVTGLATPNPNGTIEFGLTIVATPGAAPVHLAAAIGLATLGGTWSDSAGGSGDFVFTPGNGTGGSPRPLPPPVIPSLFHFQGDGGLLASGVFDTGALPASGAGTRLMWHPRKAAFRVGQVTGIQWDEGNIGVHSIAVGLDTVASDEGSVAFGRSTEASGPRSLAYGFLSKATAAHAFAGGFSADATAFGSVALGDGTTASGNGSVALGFQSTASGRTSLAVGDQNLAQGQSAVALGMVSHASDTASIAIGRDVHALGRQAVVLGSFARSLVSGAFVFGDASLGGGVVFAPAANSFTVRAAGGYTLFTNSALTTGATLAPGGSGWGVVSDARMKENFRDLDDNDVLARIARMPIREWNYTTQDTGIRHVGPTAQDFHAAFGLGEDRLRINTIDADGIALRCHPGARSAHACGRRPSARARGRRHCVARAARTTRSITRGEAVT